MSELNNSESPITRHTKNVITDNFMNFKNNKSQKFLIIVILSYFGTKIFSNFFNIVTIKSNTQETLDLLTTIVLSAVMFYLTGLSTRPTLGNDKINKMFFIGLLLGITSATIQQKLLYNMSEGWYTFFKILLIIVSCGVIALNIIISQTVASQNYITTGNYLIYICMILGLLTAMYYSKMSQITCSGPNCPNDIPSNSSDDTVLNTCNITEKDVESDSKSVPTKLLLETSQFNISFGLVSWLMSLTFIYDSTKPTYNIILTFLFGLYIGTYISNFSIYGINYIIKSKISIDENIDDISLKDLINSFNGLGISTAGENSITKILNDEKYKEDLKKSCKVKINDYVLESKNMKTSILYDCVENGNYKNGKTKITFYISKVSTIKLILVTILSLLVFIIIIYTINQFVPII